jgi:hypothetical protein
MNRLHKQSKRVTEAGLVPNCNVERIGDDGSPMHAHDNQSLSELNVDDGAMDRGYSAQAALLAQSNTQHATTVQLHDTGWKAYASTAPMLQNS